MSTISVNVPEDKAVYLKIIAANATTETLRILSEKCKGKTPEQMKQLEQKLKSFQAFI